MHNLLFDDLIRINSGEKSLSLPALLAALGKGEVRNYPGIRSLQSAAWHMFTVQISALALRAAHQSRADLSEVEWRDALMALSVHHGCRDDAWSLYNQDPTKPAFLQPSVISAPNDPSAGNVVDRKMLQDAGYAVRSTPDALDILDTGQNHHEKSSTARFARPEAWVFALVSKQTQASYGGNGHFPSSRMNGGNSSRMTVAVLPLADEHVVIPDPSVWWRSDMDRILGADEWRSGAWSIGLGALWMTPWADIKGRAQQRLAAPDPLYIDLSTFARLVPTKDGLMEAYVRTSGNGARLVSSHRGGDTGDLWAPIIPEKGQNKSYDYKAFTLGERPLSSRDILNFLFSAETRLPLLSCGSSNVGPQMLHISVLSSGQKTAGFNQVSLAFPREIQRIFGRPMGRENLGSRSSQILSLSWDARVALTTAMATYRNKGERLENLDEKSKNRLVSAAEASESVRRFDREVDMEFTERALKALSHDDTFHRGYEDLGGWLAELAKACLDSDMRRSQVSRSARPKAEAIARNHLRTNFPNFRKAQNDHLEDEAI